MERRRFVILLGAAALARPLAARAQPAGKFRRVAMLDTTSPALNAANVEAFREGLRQLGYSEGQNLVVDYHSADGRIERFAQLAVEIVRSKPDVIVTRGTPATMAAKKATTTIPIVMAASGEPVGTGLVASLSRPGGNVTGFSAFVTELTAKRIEILKELVPRMARVALLDNMSNLSVPAQWEELRRAARSFGLDSELLDVRQPADLDRAFNSALSQRVDALAVGNDSVVIANRRRVAELAIQQRLPAVYATREFVDAGGLISYATHYPDLYRRAAIYVDKIFKGEKPSELPVQQPIKFELVVNLKSARAIGLDMPATLLARADEVIE